MHSPLRDEIAAAFKEALKQQRKREMATLRLVNAAIKDRDIASRTEDGGGGVSDPEILDILAKMIKQREESAQTYADAGRAELAEGEREEIEIIRGFLPEPLSDDETRAACEAAVRELTASGLKDMGKVMAVLKENYAGRMNFSGASKIVKALLSRG